MRSFEGDHLRRPLGPGLVGTIREIATYRGKEELYCEQSPDILKTLREVAVIQSTEASNRIEGVEASRGRFEKLMREKTTPKDRSEQEIAGYRRVLDLIHGSYRAIGVTPGVILQMHRDLYQFVPGVGGRWKNAENNITERLADKTERVRFETASAALTPDYMDRLCEYHRKECDQGDVDSLLIIPTFVFDFLCIHPFPDGNGRMARLLTLLLLYRSGYEVGRYISLERIIEESKETYYDSLYRSSQGWHDGNHDLTHWWSYWLGTVLAAYKEFEDRVGVVKSRYGGKRERVLRAVQARELPFPVRELEEQCPDVSIDYIRKILKELRDEGRAECLGRGAGAKWQKKGDWSEVN